MMDLETGLSFGLVLALVLAIWAYRRAKAVIAAEKAATFLYAASVLMDAILEEGLSSEERLRKAASQLAQANGRIDGSHLLILLRATLALRLLRQSFPDGRQRPIAELGGEQLRFRAIRTAGTSSSPETNAIAARAIDLARRLGRQEDIAHELASGVPQISDQLVFNVVAAQFAIEAAIGTLYVTAISRNVEPLRSLQS